MVVAAEPVRLAREPVREPQRAAGRLVGREQARRERAELLRGHDGVVQRAHRLRDRAPRPLAPEGARAGPASRQPRRRPHELAIRECLGPHGVHDAGLDGIGRDPGDVVDVHRLHPAGPARDCEHRRAPQEPGDVVDQDLLPAAEHERRADAHGGNRAAQRQLVDGRLGAEVGIGRRDGRPRDRDVHDPLDAGRGRSPEEAGRRGDRPLERRWTAREPDPERVVEHLDPVERAREGRLVVERERGDVDAALQGVSGRRRRAHQRPHRAVAAEELVCDRGARVRERPGDRIHAPRIVDLRCTAAARSRPRGRIP